MYFYFAKNTVINTSGADEIVNDGNKIKDGLLGGKS